MSSSLARSLKRRFKLPRKAHPAKKATDSHRGNPEANPVPGIGLHLCHDPWKLSVPLGEFLEMAQPQVEFVVPGFVAKGQTTLVRVAPGVDYKWYLNGIAVAVTAAISLAPYGKISGCQTTLAYIGSIAQRTHEQLDMYRAKLKSDMSRDWVNRHLHVVSLRDIQKQLLMVDQYWYSVNSEALISSEKNLLIVPDAHLAIGTHKDAWTKLDGDLAFKRLADPEMAVLACFQTDRRTWESMHDSIWTRRSYRFVEFIPWNAAPKQYGSGFTIRLDKTSEYDSTPLVFNVWYWVEDGKIELGWQVHDSTEPSSYKQTEIAERRRQIADLLERKIPQKEIATILQIDESTVSRDVQALKSAKTASKQNAANDEGIDQTA